MDADKFLARLCALVPPPGFHMVRYFGVFASHHHLRPRVIPSRDTELPGQQLPLDFAGRDAAEVENRVWLSCDDVVRAVSCRILALLTHSWV
jgi:hypothetical protein